MKPPKDPKAAPPALFISHSGTDRHLADRFVELLQLGIGIPAGAIFCSSQPAHGVRPGTRFPKEIDERLREASVFIPLLTQNFLASQYALAEIGMARTLEKWSVPVMFVSAGEAATPLLLLSNAQAVDANDANRLDTLLDVLRERLKLPAIPAAQWNHAKEEFYAAIEPAGTPTGGPCGFNPNVSAGSPTQIFATSDSNEFRSCVESRIGEARHVVMVGTGLNLLHRDSFVDDCLRRVEQGDLSLEIYLADPGSPEVQTRLIEEELGAHRPPVGRGGLQQRLHALVDEQQRMGFPRGLSVSVFRNYPTFAVIQIDEGYYFMYPYGYATLGNYSPVLELDSQVPGHRGFIRFLQNHIDGIRKVSLSAAQVVGAVPTPVADLTAVAVYAIPPASSRLYSIGSALLGYDVRDRQKLSSPLRGLAGGAGFFGLHLTIGDVLYFNAGDHAWAIRELKALVAEFQSFTVTDLRLRSGFPDPSSVSLSVSDPTGNLEALHCEIVFRLYRRARSSNYSLDPALLARGRTDRDRLMIERYRAPYIFKEFQPHITLASGLAPEQVDEVERVAERELGDVLGEETYIAHLALMQQASNGYWQIEQELPLGRS